MVLTSLKFTGFRNLENGILELDDKVPVTAFVGNNGQGKTNLLEAVFLCALSKSFRTSRNEELIAFEEPFCRLEAVVKKGNKETLLEVIITRQPARKALKVNGVVKSAAEFIGHLPVVFFSPDDVSALAQAPRFRRRYIDVLLSQLDRVYLKELLDYQHAISQRNALLRRLQDKKAEVSELDFWDQRLIKIGGSIVQKRFDLIQSLQPKVVGHYQTLAQSNESIRIDYRPSAALDRFADQLTASRDRDIATGFTSIGPHRDDVDFYSDDHDMLAFASRGEWRSVVLALKFAEIQFLQSQLETAPILLLDDVFSELDDDRHQYLLAQLEGFQVFLTTTHSAFVQALQLTYEIHSLKDGKIV